jgi:hypothetical protein
MTGSKSLKRLSEAEGYPTRYGARRLGFKGSWGKWEPLAPNRMVEYYPDTRRLKVEWSSSADGGTLIPLDGLREYLESTLMPSLVLRGIEPMEPPKLARVDVAVDGMFAHPDVCRAALSALYAARYPYGRRVFPYGDPVSTIQIRSKSGKERLGRAYDKGAQQNLWPWELLRIESSTYFPRQQHRPLAQDFSPFFGASLWRGIWGALPEVATTVRRSALYPTLATMVEDGRITVPQMERMRNFLEAEALGYVHRLYSPRMATERRREARKLGLRVEDFTRGDLEFELGQIFREYDEALPR